MGVAARGKTARRSSSCQTSAARASCFSASLRPAAHPSRSRRSAKGRRASAGRRGCLADARCFTRHPGLRAASRMRTSSLSHCQVVRGRFLCAVVTSAGICRAATWCTCTTGRCLRRPSISVVSSWPDRSCRSWSTSSRARLWVRASWRSPTPARWRISRVRAVAPRRQLSGWIGTARRRRSARCQRTGAILSSHLMATGWHWTSTTGSRPTCGCTTGRATRRCV